MPALFGVIFLAVLMGHCSDGSGTEPPSIPNDAPPPASPPNPVPTLPGPPGGGGETGNQPPVPAFKVTPFPATGQAPLVVNFNLCPTADPDGDKIVFFFGFGDGTTAQGPPCRQQNTYHAGRYTANMCVWDSRPEHSLQCVAFAVDAK
jgi:hypothetical protein